MAIPAPNGLALLLAPHPLTTAMGTTGLLTPALLLQVLDAGLLIGETLADAQQVHDSPPGVTPCSASLRIFLSP